MIDIFLLHIIINIFFKYVLFLVHEVKLHVSGIYIILGDLHLVVTAQIRYV